MSAGSQVQRVELLHGAVPGRARLRVGGLRRSERLARALERELRGCAAVESARANPRTGTLLVHFCEPLGVAGLLEDVARILAMQPQEAFGPEPRGAPSRSHLAPSFGIAGSLRLLRHPRLLAAVVAARSRAARASPPRPAPEEPPLPAWHLREVEACLAEHDTCPERGLALAEAAERFARVGPNALPRPAPRSTLGILLEQIETLPVAMLAGSAVLSIATGGLADAAVIGAVVLVNAMIGFSTERQAEHTIRSIIGGSQPNALVLRGGLPRSVPGEEVVPGDVLCLGPGASVLADARVVEETRLSIDESALTGESMPVAKSAGALADADTPLADRCNMIYRGTLVNSGSGRAVVVATGPRTEIGRIQRLVGEARPPETPSQHQLRELGDKLVLAGGVVCAGVFAVGALRGYGLVQMLRTSVSLAVAALPEGLPTVATTTLALGVRQLRRQRVLVRHIDAVETLGAVQTLCLDKTGTITANRMQAVALHADGRHLDVAGRKPRVAGTQASALRRLLEACVLCNEVEIAEEGDERVLEGSPTERALVELAYACGIDAHELRRAHPLLGIEHRSDLRNYMTSVHELGGGRRLVAVKGSPSEVLSRCRRIRCGAEVRELTDADHSALDAENGSLAGQALRVLGVAYAEHDGGEETEDGLTWLGLVGMADPPREGIRELVELFHGAGIDTTMITGDQSATAYAVARELHLARDGSLEILDSTRFEQVPAEVLSALAQRVQVFSRVTPAHKLEIVQALQRAGRVVAMTGDGINDGPALKAADIGIAMGQAGSEIARGVSDVVLENDELGSLVGAIRQGRTIHENTRKAIHYLLSSNSSEILVTFGAIAFGLGQPLTAMQLLWLNLMTDVFPGLALAVEPPEPDVLRRPSRDPHEPLLRREDFGRIAAEGTLLSAGALASFAAALRRHGPGARANTAGFMTLTLGQLLHALSSRSSTRSLFDRGFGPMNPALKITVGVSAALQAATPWIPGLSRLLGLTRPGWRDALWIGAGSLLPVLAHEALKKAGLWSPAQPGAAEEQPPEEEAP